MKETDTQFDPSLNAVDNDLPLPAAMRVLAAWLEQMAGKAEPTPSVFIDIEDDVLQAAKRHYGERRRRSRLFVDGLFGEPAWDMLLDLFIAGEERRPISVSSLCIAAAVPSTTALRWLSYLVDEKLVVRVCDPFDRRRVFVELTGTASDRMRAYLTGA